MNKIIYMNNNAKQDLCNYEQNTLSRFINYKPKV